MKLSAACSLAVALSLPAVSGELHRLSLDDAAAIGIRIETDRQVKVEGTASVRITTDWPTTICLAEVDGLEVENVRLVYRARVKSDLDGSAFLEMWAHVAGGRYFSRGMDSTVGQKSDWTTLSTPFIFQRGQKPDRLTLNVVIDGRGSVWVDDIVLSTEPLEN